MLERFKHQNQHQVVPDCGELFILQGYFIFALDIKRENYHLTTQIVTPNIPNNKTRP